MGTSEMRTEIDRIDVELLRLLERRSQLVERASAARESASARHAETMGAERVRTSTAGALYASLSHPEAHVQLGDLP